jgi:T5SS/PEP-CTERM-associated repeat protein
MKNAKSGGWSKRLLCCWLFVLGSTFLSAQTTPFGPTTITFNEYPFPTANNTLVSNTSFALNLLNDSNGAVLSHDNGDLRDLTFTFNEGSPAPFGGTSSTTWQTANLGQFTSTTSFTKPVASNNPGNRVFSEMTINFDSHLTITNLSARFSSLNTAGIGWEFSLIGYFRPNGTPFSPQPTVPPYLAASGTSGNIAPGWFLAGSKGTLTGVGTAQSASGVSGPNDGTFTMNYAAGGLAPGTQVGGLVFLHFLEDTRGTRNAATNFTASITDLTFSGTSTMSSGPVVNPGNDTTIGDEPGATGDVTINGSSSTLASDGDVTVGNEGNGLLDVINGGTVTDKNGIVGDGSTGTVVVDGNGSHWNNSGALEVGPSSPGLVDIADGGAVNAAGGTTVGPKGEIMGDGTITTPTLINDGIVMPTGPDGTPGTLTENGNYQQGAGGTLDIGIGGSKPSQTDELKINGAAKLDGTLELAPLNNFHVSPGDTYEIISATGGTTGKFTRVVDTVNTNRLTRADIIAPNGVVVTYLPAGFGVVDLTISAPLPLH